ncbi:MAG: hypothetical protein LBN32_04790 [Helicobacteraceae bacterium]|jgi:hypothetical protein|nr:hypothetical protein [Helicobacteraceae bacterium]
MRILFLALLTTAMFAGNAYQLPLKSGVWHLVGVNGLRPSGSFSVPNGLRVITDTNDTNRLFTWDTESNGSITDHNRSNSGDETKSTLGIRVIETDSNLQEVKIYYGSRQKNKEPLLGMFVSSAGNSRQADVDIHFQKGYEGQKFYMTFGNSTIVYEGIFDPKYTRANPLNPIVARVTSVTKIEENVDANLSDNNLSALDLAPRELLKTTAGESITAYWWNQRDMMWDIYTYGYGSGNNNYFAEFESAKAYWIKLNTVNDDAGLLLAKDDLNHSFYNSNLVKQNWNMLSFNDSFIRQAASAVFVPAGATVSVRDNFYKSEINATFSDINSVKAFNKQAYMINAEGNNSWKIRAYQSEGGVALISDEDFEIYSASAVKTTADQPLLMGLIESVEYKEARTDEYYLALKINEALFNQTQKSAIQIGFVGGESFKIDFSGGALSATQIINAINTQLGAKAKAYPIDLDSSGSSDTALISAKERFYVRDITYNRLFDYDPSASPNFFRIQSSSLPMPVLIQYGTTNATADAISNSSLNIRAYEINGSRILLNCVDCAFELWELGKDTKFSDVYIYNERNETVKGAITAVYSPIALANAAIDDEGKAYEPTRLTDDLNFVAQFSPDFPIDGPLYALQNAAGESSSPEIILSGVTRDDQTIMWRQADLTVDAQKHRTDKPRFNLFKAHKERGYWVYMREGGAQPAMTPVLSHNMIVTRRYSNLFDTNASNALAPTYNHIALDVFVSVSGLGDQSGDLNFMPENVFLRLGEESLPMLRNGRAGEYIVRLTSHDLKALSPKNPASPKTYMGLSIANGLGGALHRSTIDFDNRQPPSATYFFDTNSTIDKGKAGGIRVLASEEVKKIYVYDGNLTDQDTQNEQSLIYTVKINKELNLSAHELDKIAFGNLNHPYYDLRLIGEADQLRSDIRRILFAPVYKGSHLISAIDGNMSETLAFDHDGQSYKRYLDNNNVPARSGVWLASADNNKTVMTYLPLVMDNTTPPINMTDLMINGKKIGRIKFNSVYENKLFYIYHPEQNLSYGIFPATGTNELNLTAIDSNQTIEDPLDPNSSWNK